MSPPCVDHYGLSQIAWKDNEVRRGNNKDWSGNVNKDRLQKSQRFAIRVSWSALGQQRACCPAPTKEQNSMAAKLVVKFPKDVFASARQTNCIK